MRFSTYVAAALALLVAPACAPVRAEVPWGAPDGDYASAEPYDPEEAPYPDDYREQLGAYGAWYEDPSYGPIWQPTYPAGWQPYVDGYWAWTAYGWTWISYEPWAWTLHYGRWLLLPAHGWVWVPGTVWGPAWVDWYWGDGYVGWAPLSPFGHVIVINDFVFVRERDFCSRSVRRHVIHHGRVPDRVHRQWRERDHRRPPRHDRIERVSRDPVTRLDDRPRQTLAPHRERRLARPDTPPDLTGARREEEGRAGRHARPDAGPPTVTRPAWRSDDPPRRDRDARGRTPAVRLDRDDAAAGRALAPGWSGRPRADARPDRAPRTPRFDGDDGALVRPRGDRWSGGRTGDDGHRAAGADSSHLGGSTPRSSEGGRDRGGGTAPGGASTGLATGAR